MKKGFCRLRAEELAKVLNNCRTLKEASERLRLSEYAIFERIGELRRLGLIKDVRFK